MNTDLRQRLLQLLENYALELRVREQAYTRLDPTHPRLHETEAELEAVQRTYRELSQL